MGQTSQVGQRGAGRGRRHRGGRPRHVPTPTTPTPLPHPADPTTGVRVCSPSGAMGGTGEEAGRCSDRQGRQAGGGAAGGPMPGAPGKGQGGCATVGGAATTPPSPICPPHPYQHLSYGNRGWKDDVGEHGRYGRYGRAGREGMAGPGRRHPGAGTGQLAANHHHCHPADPPCHTCSAGTSCALELMACAPMHLSMAAPCGSAGRGGSAAPWGGSLGKEGQLPATHYSPSQPASQPVSQSANQPTSHRQQRCKKGGGAG